MPSQMGGSTAAIGKEGRLFLAERLAEREGKADLVDAELQYWKLTNDDLLGKPQLLGSAHLHFLPPGRFCRLPHIQQLPQGF